jgi:hypothetical protein
VASATHIFDDLIFVGSYFLFLRQIARPNSRKVLMTLNGVYLCGLFVAVAFIVVTNVTTPHDAFIENTLLYVSYPVSSLSQL